MFKGNVETGISTSGTVEPTGSLWTTLKCIFFILLALLAVETGALIYICVILGGIINGDPNYIDQSDPYPEVTQKFAKIMLGIAIPTVILVFFQFLTGTIGILRLRIGFLYAFAGLMCISMIISTVNFFLGGGVYKLAPLIAAVFQYGMITLANKLIKLINEANGH